jgi:hypothetical protein
MWRWPPGHSGEGGGRAHLIAVQLEIVRSGAFEHCVHARQHTILTQEIGNERQRFPVQQCCLKHRVLEQYVMQKLAAPDRGPYLLAGRAAEIRARTGIRLSNVEQLVAQLHGELACSELVG